MYPLRQIPELLAEIESRRLTQEGQQELRCLPVQIQGHQLVQVLLIINEHIRHVQVHLQIPVQLERLKEVIHLWEVLNVRHRHLRSAQQSVLQVEVQAAYHQDHLQVVVVQEVHQVQVQAREEDKYDKTHQQIFCFLFNNHRDYI